MPDKPAGIRLGFDFVPFPEDIWTRDLALSMAAFRILGYLLKHTVRFGQVVIVLSDDELLHGRLDRNEARIDSGCGIKGRNNFKNGREELVDLGWLSFSGDGRSGIKYQLIIAGSPAAVPDVAEPKCPNRTPAQPRKVSESDTEVSESDSASVRIGQERNIGSKSSLRTIKTKPHLARSAAADPRHHAVRESIKRLQKHLLKYEIWDGRAAAALDKMLKSAPLAATESLVAAVVCRALSKELPFSEHPARWLSNLTLYQCGPVDGYKKLLREQAGSDRLGTEFENLARIAYPQGAQVHNNGQNSGTTWASRLPADRFARARELAVEYQNILKAHTYTKAAVERAEEITQLFGRTIGSMSADAMDEFLREIV